MSRSGEIPDCCYSAVPQLIPPKGPTPTHSLYLTNIDDQKWLRFHSRFLMQYERCVCADRLRASLSGILLHYYPLAGRLRVSEEDGEKLQIYCNGEGALFSEATMDLTAEEFRGLGALTINSWNKLLYMKEGQPFLETPLLVVQVTKLRCGAMILCFGICHCVVDGFGLSQFLHDWACIIKDPHAFEPSGLSHVRDSLRPRNPLKITYIHPEYDRNNLNNLKPIKTLAAQAMIPMSFTFSLLQLSRLKNMRSSSLSCTSYEALASHVWIAWVRSIRPPTHTTKLLIVVNVRKGLHINLSPRYYGNAFVLGCAEATVEDLASLGIQHGVKLIQEAKRRIKDDYFLSVIDFMEEKRATVDTLGNLMMSEVKHHGYEEIDYGSGKPVHLAALFPEYVCSLLPCPGVRCGTTVVLSMPESAVDVFKMHMKFPLNYKM